MGLPRTDEEMDRAIRGAATAGELVALGGMIEAWLRRGRRMEAVRLAGGGGARAGRPYLKAGDELLGSLSLSRRPGRGAMVARWRAAMAVAREMDPGAPIGENLWTSIDSQGLLREDEKVDRFC